MKFKPPVKGIHAHAKGGGAEGNSPRSMPPGRPSPVCRPHRAPPPGTIRNHSLEFVGFFHILSGASQVLPTLLFVVAFFGNRTDRATINALATSSICKKQAIGSVVGIWPRRRRNGHLGDDRSDPHGFALGGDQPVAQTESAQTGGIGGMAFRPGRSIGKPLRFDDGPVGNQHRSNGRMAGLFEALGHVPTQGNVELLAVDPDPGPFFGRIFLGLAVGLANPLTLGQNPRNDGQFVGAGRFVRDGAG